MTSRPSEVTEILREELDRFGERVMQRVESAETTSAREVLAAGTAVNRIVEQARGCVAAVQDLVGDQIATIERYVGQTEATVEAHDRALARTLQDAEAVSAAGTQIGELAFQAKLLSLNARIEASRAAEGEAFAVIAREMRTLSEAISRSNECVADTASSMTASLTELRGHAVRVRDNSQALSRDLTTVSEHGRKTFGNVAAESGLIHDIVQTAYEALSHLQFQDPMVQQLHQIRSLLHEFADTLTRTLGVTGTRWSGPPASRSGGADPRVDDAGEEPEAAAGEVLLF